VFFSSFSQFVFLCNVKDGKNAYSLARSSGNYRAHQFSFVQTPKAQMGIFPDNNPEHLFYFDFRRLRKVVSDSNFVVETMYTRFCNVFQLSFGFCTAQDFLFGWIPRVFPKLGDNIFEVVHCKQKEK
jgi:hypothetical protein